MLFSGIVQAFRCTQCNCNFSRVIPTSFIPISTVVIVAGILWYRTLLLWIGIQLVAFLLGFVFSILSMYLVFEVLDRLTTSTLRDGFCPRCGGSMKAAGGGFYDGAVPAREELLTYFITLLLAFSCWMMAGAV